MKLPRVSNNVQYDVRCGSDGVEVRVECKVGGSICVNTVKVCSYTPEDHAERCVDYAVKELEHQVGAYIVRGSK